MEKSFLNQEQRAAVEHGGGPLLVLAGAGSGKTRVLTHRAAWLVSEGVARPEEIALLTFTNKAANEMRERIKKIGKDHMDLGFAGTFHTLCARLLRRFGVNVGVNLEFTIFDADDSETIMKEVLKSMSIDPSQSKPKVLLSLISRMKNDLVSESEAEAAARDYFFRQLVRVRKAYQEKLRVNKAVDFDDLLVKAVELLRIDRIRAEVNEQLKWILVDEYQDTNKAQFELTRLLAGERKNITAVGDVAQAIYSFRGADYRNLRLLEEAFPQLVKIDLPRNYRSTQHILDAAYGVVSNNRSHPTIKLLAEKSGGPLVELIEAEDERHEAKMVIEGARKAVENGMEIAILYRTNSQSRSFEDELLRRDIPYKLVGGVRFYGRSEIKDLMSYLRLIKNPEEELSRNRVNKIGKRKAAMFDNWSQKLTKDQREKTKPVELLESVINTTGYLDRFDERDEEDADRIANINELLAVAEEFENLDQFLESAALSEAEVKQRTALAKISLMTVHAAKGLEFGKVFVVGMEEGLFPHSRSISSGEREEIEEERRLMYVAMTRAQEELVISFARSRLVYGGRKSSVPSRFLAEIPGEYLKRKVGRTTIGMDEKSTYDKPDGNDNFDKRRIIVQDWEIEEAVKSDFADIDNW